MKENVIVSKGKKVRDTIHGDIFLPNKFLKVVDTKEFQRLRRIRQLATASMVFPGAEHTRYSHSLGTYHIMKRIIEHFKIHLEEMNLTIGEDEENVALAAALLHDIGHGPFSHAFEGLTSKTKHEEWTIKIITSDTDVNKVLKEEFGYEFPEKVAKLISKGVFRSEESGVDPKYNVKKDMLDLSLILQSLVSSQIDADRMDYLLRDALYTGVTFGKIDIGRLISSMSIVVKDEKFCVGISEKYLSDIENYLLARYQMHSEVYFDEFKCQMELIIKKILERAKELYTSNNLELDNIPITKLFKEEQLEVSEYVNLDDSVLVNLFSTWRNNPDSILSHLCCCFLERKKYTKLRLLNNSEKDIQQFKKGLELILKENNYIIKDFKNEYFWIENHVKFPIYKNNKENILVLKNNGVVEDLTNVSSVIKKDADSLNVNLIGQKSMAFMNFQLLELLEGIHDKEKVKKQIKELMYMYDNRNHIEIEKKYVVEDKNIFEQVEAEIDKYNKFTIEKNEIKKQEDYYYDTEDKLLYNQNNTLRIRKKGGSYCLTIKTPAQQLGKESSCESERFEYEVMGESDNIVDYKEFILEHLKSIINEHNFSNLKNMLTISNNRRKIVLKKKTVELEMVFDDVNYINGNGKNANDYQIEIELKSDYPHKANLKLLCDHIEDNVTGLKVTNTSKYKRGLDLTK